jgi:hypothetical protein
VACSRSMTVIWKRVHLICFLECGSPQPLPPSWVHRAAFSRSCWHGLAGAWLIYLEPFVVYRRVLVLLAVVVIAAGWWLALRRGASRGTLVVLASASALTLGAVAVTEYEGPLQRYVLSLKRG